MSTGGSWWGETKRRLEENGINKHDLRWDRKELQTGLEIQIWNYLYTGRKWHCVWTDELSHWDKHLLERAETLGFTLRKYGNLGVVKAIEIFKRKRKGCSRDGSKGMTENKTSFLWLYWCLPCILLPKLGAWLLFFQLYTFFLDELIPLHSFSYHLSG